MLKPILIGFLVGFAAFVIARGPTAETPESAGMGDDMDAGGQVPTAFVGAEARPPVAA